LVILGVVAGFGYWRRNDQSERAALAFASARPRGRNSSMLDDQFYTAERHKSDAASIAASIYVDQTTTGQTLDQMYAVPMADLDELSAGQVAAGRSKSHQPAVASFVQPAAGRSVSYNAAGLSAATPAAVAGRSVSYNGSVQPGINGASNPSYVSQGYYGADAAYGGEAAVASTEYGADAAYGGEVAVAATEGGAAGGVPYKKSAPLMELAQQLAATEVNKQSGQYITLGPAEMSAFEKATPNEYDVAAYGANAVEGYGPTPVDGQYYDAQYNKPQCDDDGYDNAVIAPKGGISREDRKPSVYLGFGEKDGMDQVTTEVLAMFDFAATDADEVSFKKGDRFELVEKSNAEWWTVRIRDSTGGYHTGLAPSNMLHASSSSTAL